MPAQTAAHENHLLIAQQQQLQQLIDAQTIQHRVQQQVCVSKPFLILLSVDFKICRRLRQPGTSVASESLSSQRLSLDSDY